MKFPIDLNDFIGLPLNDGNRIEEFDSFAVCRICGAVYAGTLPVQQLWLDSHNDLHSPQEHYDLEASAMSVTTEAFTRLEALGLQSIVGSLK